MQVKKKVIEKVKAGTHQIFLNGSKSEIKKIAQLFGIQVLDYNDYFIRSGSLFIESFNSCHPNKSMINIKDCFVKPEEKEQFPFYAKDEKREAWYRIKGKGVNNKCYDAVCINHKYEEEVGRSFCNLEKSALTKIPNPFV